MPRVCVIGAGAAGLCAAKNALLQRHKVTIYEKGSELGGTWVYQEARGGHSSMYKDLKTNIPKQVMLFRDVPFSEELPSFIRREDVLKYLQDFGADIPILYNHTVKNVKRIGELWEESKFVTVKCGDNETTALYDVVFVCNGHYSAPNLNVDTSKYQGHAIHSHDYRTPLEFSHQKVVVIGAGPSGMDIALQVAEFADEVHVVGRLASLYKNMPANVTKHDFTVKQIEGFNVHLSNEQVIDNVDAVIVCTGYLYSFPFLNEDIISVTRNGQMVSPLYEHVIHVQYTTSLFFIGLTHLTATFPVFELQVKLSLALISGEAPLPSPDELSNWETERLRILEKVDHKEANFHCLGEEKWDYCDRLCRLGQLERWPYLDLMKELWTYVDANRERNFSGYTSVEFIVSGTTFVVNDPAEKIL